MWLLLACSGPEPVVSQPSDVPVPPEVLHFDGVQTLSWNGAQIVAEWEAATGEAPISYEVVVTDHHGGDEQRFPGAESPFPIPDLSVGEWDVRVEATDGLGDTLDGDLTLTQLMGRNRLVYRSEVPLPGAADVWGQDEIVVLAGRDSGLSWMVVDASDPERPAVLETRYDAGYVKDIKIADGLMFTNGECGCRTDSEEWQTYDRIGVRIFDFEDPTNPRLVGTIGGDTAASVHNVAYEAGVVYVSDNDADAVGLYDIADPSDPEHLGDWVPPRAFVHDQAVVDGKLYVAFWAGFAVVDVSDPRNPVDEVVHLRTDGGSAVHNIWPNADGSHVLTTDERPGGHVRIYDVRKPDEVVQVAEFQTSPSHIVHNVHVRGDFAYVSYYVDGVYVLDISDPANPEVVGWYDTFTLDLDTGHSHDTAIPSEEHSHDNRLYDGAWGIWPFGTHVAIGDMQRGLILMDHVPDVVDAPTHDHP